MTTWTVETQRGKMLKVRVLGANGRVSYGGGRGEGPTVRFYRSPTAKHYDAVIPEVKTIWNDNVLIEEMGKTPELAEAEKVQEAFHKERFDKAIEAVLAGRKVEDDEDYGYGTAVSIPVSFR